MKYILSVLFLFFFFSGFTQIYQEMPQYGYRANRMAFDSTLQIPTVCGVPTLKSVVSVNKKAALAFDSCNNRFYTYNPKTLTWSEVSGGGATPPLQDVITAGNEYTDGFGNTVRFYEYESVAGVDRFYPLRFFDNDESLPSVDLVEDMYVSTQSSEFKIGNFGNFEPTNFTLNTSGLNIKNSYGGPTNEVNLNYDGLKIYKSENEYTNLNFLNSNNNNENYDVHLPIQNGSANDTLNTLQRFRSDTTNKWVNDIYRTSGVDSIYYTIGSTTYAIKDSAGGGTVTSIGLTMPSAFSVANSPVTTSGTIAVTGAGVVSQYIRGDGSLANFPTSTGGGSSVNYYLNGSVSQGTFGGIAFREMNKTPIIGAGTDFTINADGYIQSFITDAGDPSLLNIPAGNWNFEMYFSASSSGGLPSFYLELYKWNGTTLSLIASSSATPENITGGTAIDLYTTALAVPATTLLSTDRLAVRVYVIHSSKTITLHTENSHLCQIITTFSSGLTALNGLTEQVQNFATGTGGTDFNISSATATHTFNLPTASATNRGALSSANWSTFNSKISPSDTATMLTPYLRKIDTASLSSRINLKLNISDTASMLTQYIRLAGTGLTKSSQTLSNNLSTGVAGGQSVVGGTAASNSLTLSSTTNATKGKLLFGTSAYDEVNNRLGIGTTSPTDPIHIRTAGTGTNFRTNFNVENTNTAGAASMQFINGNGRNAFIQYTGSTYVIGEGLAIFTESDMPVNYFSNGANPSGGTSYFAFSPGGYANESVRFFGSKNVGFNTTTDAGYRIDVNGTARVQGALNFNPTNTASGTTGNRTINKTSGTVNIAAAGTTVTVTNSLVTASSIVFAVIRTNDATATIKNVVPAAGSFVINLNAATTAETSIGFFVIN